MATLMEKDVLIEKIANLTNDLMLHHKEPKISEICSV